MTLGPGSGQAAIALVRFRADGELELYAYGAAAGFRFLVVDERCPGDRVFEVTERHKLAELEKLVPPGSAVGSRLDAHHQALLNRVAAARDGVPYLRPVGGGE